MKILIISHMYPSPSNSLNGIFVQYQVRALQRLGCEVAVISPVPMVPALLRYFKPRWQSYYNTPSSVADGSVKIMYPRYLAFPRSVLFSFSGVMMFIAIYTKVSRLFSSFKFDLIHCHVALPDGFAGVLLAKKFRKHLFVTIHGQDLQQTINRNKRCREVVKMILDNATNVVVVSNKLKIIAQDIIQKDRVDRVNLIPNGVNPDLIASSNPETDLINRYSGRRIILSVSSLVITKGVDLNLKAITKLKKFFPDLLYLIIGSGSERQYLEKMAVALGLIDHVKFLGALNNNEVIKYMKMCEVFSLPSWKEGFGVVYLEAMACGRPVIACRGEGIDGVLKNLDNGLLVNPKDEKSLYDALYFLLSNNEKSRQISNNGRMLVLGNYSWEKSAILLIKQYKDVLEGKYL